MHTLPLCQGQTSLVPAAVTAGALVSGPDASGAFSDDRTRPEYTSASLDGNAVLSGLFAGLIARDVQPGACNGGRGEGPQGSLAVRKGTIWCGNGRHQWGCQPAAEAVCIQLGVV